MYVIVDVTADAGQLEPMGSKPKFWFEHAEWGNCLFKAARPESGEDWAEKLAEQFAQAMGTPHATHELAEYRGERGIVTPRLTTDAQRLVHGNELLIELDAGYEAGNVGYRTPLHTVDAVIGALQATQVALPQECELPRGVTTCADVFAGYLLLDALIGNTDRHHENWAAVEDPGLGATPRLFLAPTFDHASSMGRNEPADRMSMRLETADSGFSVEAYARKARSALYSSRDAARPLSPLDAFASARRLAPAGAKAWCAQLQALSDQRIMDIIGGVPEQRMTLDARQFVARMLIYNRKQLEKLCRSL